MANCIPKLRFNPVETSSAQLYHAENSYLEARITATALACFALFFASAGILLLGVGTYPSTMYLGLGLLPSGVGAILLVTGAATALSALGFTALAIQRYIASRTLTR